MSTRALSSGIWVVETDRRLSYFLFMLPFSLLSLSLIPLGPKDSGAGPPTFYSIRFAFVVRWTLFCAHSLGLLDLVPDCFFFIR